VIVGTMADTHGNTVSEFGMRIRNVFFVLLATGLFLLKRQYSGPFEILIHSYAGNIFASFAVYINFLNLSVPHRSKRLLAALLALICVESFELFNGFGLMSNTYDAFDLLANAFGVGCAYGLDKILSLGRSRRSTINSKS
jgi:hypothetical protein